MLFKEIFPSYNIFQTWVNVIVDVYRDDSNIIKAEWLDETIMFSTYKIIFYHLNNFYRNRTIRYNLDDWMNLFTNRFVDSTFDLFFKQQAFYKKELKTINSYEERGTVNVANSSGGDTNNSSTTSNTFSGTNEPLSTTDNVANKTQSKTILDSTTTNGNYNIIDNLKMMMNYRYRIGIDDFIESFNQLFRQFIGGQIKQTFNL